MGLGAGGVGEHGWRAGLAEAEQPGAGEASLRPAARVALQPLAQEEGTVPQLPAGTREGERLPAVRHRIVEEVQPEPGVVAHDASRGGPSGSDTRRRLRSTDASFVVTSSWPLA